MEKKDNHASCSHVAVPVNNGIVIKLAGDPSANGHIITIKAVSQSGGSCLVNEKLHTCTDESQNCGKFPFDKPQPEGQCLNLSSFMCDIPITAKVTVHGGCSSNSIKNSTITHKEKAPFVKKEKSRTTRSGDAHGYATRYHGQRALLPLPMKDEALVTASKSVKKIFDPRQSTKKWPLRHKCNKTDVRKLDCKKAFAFYKENKESTEECFFKDCDRRPTNGWITNNLCRRKNKRNMKSQLLNLGELGRIIGMGKADLTLDKKNLRRKSIKNKVMQPAPISLSTAEEYDIHCRAAAFIDRVTAEPEFVLRGEGKDKHLQAWMQVFPTKKKRRRHLTVKENRIFVSSVENDCPEYESYVTLDDGTTLLRPPRKLIELVAEAVNESPDGLLQVHHVYNIITAKYPYFQHMREEYLTSWRSSIRHALYQKWFRKIVFRTSLINSKGCYWSLNRKLTPKEWKLPEKKDSENDYYSLSDAKDAGSYPSEVERVLFDTEDKRYTNLVMEDSHSWSEKNGKDSGKEESVETEGDNCEMENIEEKYRIINGQKPTTNVDCLLHENNSKQLDELNIVKLEGEFSMNSSCLIDQDDDWAMQGQEVDPMLNHTAILNAKDHAEVSDVVLQQNEGHEYPALEYKLQNESGIWGRISPYLSTLQNETPLWNPSDISKPWYSSTCQEFSSPTSTVSTLDSSIDHEDTRFSTHTASDIATSTENQRKNLCPNLESVSTDYTDMSLWWNIL